MDGTTAHRKMECSAPNSCFRNRMKKTKPDDRILTVDRDRYVNDALARSASRDRTTNLRTRHVYRISPGSLYPLLHSLEKKGYLSSRERRNGKSLRKEYRATPRGKKALKLARSKVLELLRELIEGE